MPARIRRPTQVAERSDSGDAQRDVGRPLPPRAAERVAHDHADVRPGELAEPGAHPARGGIRVDGKQDEDALARRVGRVDAGGGADEAVPRLGDHERGPGAEDLAALAEDHLGAARISVLARELDRAGGRLDVGEPYDSALDLRDGLLGDDDDVGVLRARRQRRRRHGAGARDPRPPRAPAALRAG